MAAAGIGAGLVGGVLGFGAQAWSQSFSRKQSSRARRFARWQMANRYQLMVQDLKKAGLNPILAVSQSPGTPAAPTLGAGMASGMGGGMMESVRAGLTMDSEIERAHHEAARVGAEGAKAEESVRLMREQERLTEAQTRSTAAQEKFTDSQRKNVDVSTALSATGLAGARAQEKLDRSKIGERLRQLNRVIRSIRGADQTTAR